MRLSIICLFFIVCSAAKCKKNPFFESVLRLSIENKSSKGLTAYYSFQYPDTSLPVTHPELIFGIPPSQTVGKDYTENDWSDVFSRAPRDTISIFLFSSDTLVKYSWPEIRQGYKILKRYDVSQADMEAVDYTITYP